MFRLSVARLTRTALSGSRSYIRPSARPAFANLPSRPSGLRQTRWASSTSTRSSTSDPAEAEAIKALEDGTRLLEEGDIEGSQTAYKRSLDIKRTPSALFNYGVTCYHLKEFSNAIDAWKESIELQPDSPDAHTNLASAYIMQPVPRPDLAVQHLRTASTIAPHDAEIAFNLGAVLEATGDLEGALKEYQRSKEFGVERADVHVRNVSAKILGKRLKDIEAEEKEKKEA